MFEKVKEKEVKGQTIIVRKLNPEAKAAEKAAARERAKRYGRRFHKIREKSIVADYLRDNTATMYVIEEGSKELLPVLKNVPRQQVRETANWIAKLMESYEKLCEKGHITVQLIVK